MVNVEKLKTIGGKAVGFKNSIRTEEATKTSLILPVLEAVGYDIYDPAELIPEYVADFGVKQGEKVDYAININGELSVIVEAKVYGKRLDDDVSQLYRYYSVTPAKFAILTNGIEYRFYTDIVQSNIMDKIPYHTMFIDSLSSRDIDILRSMSPDSYDLDKAFELAKDAMVYNVVFDYVSDIRNSKDILHGIGKAAGLKEVGRVQENLIGKAMCDAIFGEPEEIDITKFANDIQTKFGDITNYSECSTSKELKVTDVKGDYRLSDEEESIVNKLMCLMNRAVKAYPSKFNTRICCQGSDGKDKTVVMLFRNGNCKPVWGFSIRGYTGEETSGMRDSIKYSGDLKQFDNYTMELIKGI